MPACDRNVRVADTKPTTFNIVAEVYQIKRDRHGNRTCNDAQHTVVKRALAGLRHKGLVKGQQDIKIYPDGNENSRTFSVANKSWR